MANSTIQQHQPLRVPRNWNTQEKALIVQLDEVFDDIYRRFGRLRIEDMGDKFRKRFEDAEGAIVEFEVDISGLTTRVSNAEGNITSMTLDISGLNTRVIDAEGAIGQLEVRAGEIEVSVGNKYDKISGITINTDGIDLTGNKYIKLNSGTSIDIRTGGTFTVQSGQFSIDANGNASFAGALNAATGTFAGTLSAACITSGTMSANRISGGTLTLGGNNNANGTLIIKDASGAQIGKWDKDGISATKGTFSGELQGPKGTIGGFTIGNDSLTANDFEVNTFDKSITIGKWILNRYGLISLNEDSVIGEWDFGMGTYGASASRKPTGISIAGDVGGSDPTHPWQTLFIDFKRTDGVFTWTRLRIERDDTYKVRFLVREHASEIAYGGGCLGSLAERWDCIFVNTINYLTMTQGSSRDIKHDIRDMPSMGARLDRLRPVTFVYDEDREERTRYGLIYEEALEAMPEICTGSEENKAINYIELIPMLLKEIQELRTRVSDLEGRN